MKYATPPFRYDECGPCIWDSNGVKVIDVRGWGYLTGHGHGALGLPTEDAVEATNRFGRRIVDLLNAEDQHARAPSPEAEALAQAVERMVASCTEAQSCAACNSQCWPREAGVVTALAAYRAGKEVK